MPNFRDKTVQGYIPHNFIFAGDAIRVAMGFQGGIVVDDKNKQVWPKAVKTTETKKDKKQ